MDAQTRELFESSLLSLAKERVREGRLSDPTASGTAKNPFCGDEIAVDVELSEGLLKSLGYEAKACSLCVASAELLSQWVEGGATGADLEKMAQSVKLALQGEAAPDGFDALASVAPFRARHKCVTLPFDAALKAVKDGES